MIYLATPCTSTIAALHPINTQYLDNLIMMLSQHTENTISHVTNIPSADAFLGISTKIMNLLGKRDYVGKFPNGGQWSGNGSDTIWEFSPNNPVFCFLRASLRQKMSHGDISHKCIVAFCPFAISVI